MRFILAVAIVTCCSARPALAQPGPAPTAEELKQLYDARQWQPLLQKIGPALRSEELSGDARARLLLMRGDAHLHLKAGPAAVAAFADAAESATEAKLKAEATANGLLMKRSNQFVYTVATGPRATAEKIDILADRRKAIEALYRDELASAGAKVGNAPAARTLPQVFAVIEKAEPLRALELHVTGDAIETRKLLAPLAPQAKDAMIDAMRRMERDVEEIRAAANERMLFPRATRDDRLIYDSQRKGLKERDREVLASIEQTCKRIMQLSQDLSRDLGGGGAGDNEALGEAGKLAEKLAMSAHTVLTDRYDRRQNQAK